VQGVIVFDAPLWEVDDSEGPVHTDVDGDYEEVHVESATELHLSLLRPALHRIEVVAIAVGKDGYGR
jgi:hypothetical protein